MTEHHPPIGTGLLLRRAHRSLLACSTPLRRLQRVGRRLQRTFVLWHGSA